MLLTSAAPGQPQIHQHWKPEGSSKAGKSTYGGVCLLNCHCQVARQDENLMGEVAAVPLSWHFQICHSFLAVSVIPKTKEGGVGCAERARPRRGLERPCRAGTMEMCQP